EDMDKVVAYLLEKETITGGEMVAIIEGRDPAAVESPYLSTVAVQERPKEEPPAEEPSAQPEEAQPQKPVEGVEIEVPPMEEEPKAEPPHDPF
ncbi:MAG: cell division protein FtsH, partial [Ruminiclostridium sp.]|nr:cell division protein FtsH [Ruminiclostridium sp.]